MTVKNGRPQGRRGGMQEARDLISLLGSLERQGNTVNAEVISHRLGISMAEAQKLLLILETAGIEHNLPLSLYSPADDELTLAFEEGIHGKPIRLTPSETMAINAALNYLQADEDDPIRKKINESYGSNTLDLKSIERTLAPNQSSKVSNTLSLISEAIVLNKALSFEYRGTNDAQSRQRIVIPKTVKRTDTAWLLTAYDLGPQTIRTFRLDRITNCALTNNPDNVDVLQANINNTHDTTSDSSCNAHLVKIEILDSDVLEMFSWPGLTCIKRESTRITATIPYYGRSSSWLPRQLAACGKRVRCLDPEVNALIMKYASQQLSLSNMLH